MPTRGQVIPTLIIAGKEVESLQAQPFFLKRWILRRENEMQMELSQSVHQNSMWNGSLAMSSLTFPIFPRHTVYPQSWVTQRIFRVGRVGFHCRLSRWKTTIEVRTLRPGDLSGDIYDSAEMDGINLCFILYPMNDTLWLRFLIWPKTRFRPVFGLSLAYPLPFFN